MQKKQVKSPPEAIKELKFNDSQRIILCSSLYKGWKKVNKSNAGIGKPAGMWYSVGSSWIDWCISEQDNWITKYIYEVNVDHSIMLVIDDVLKFDEFQQKYRANTEYFGDLDWDKVAKDYSGVEIAPYIWGKRLKDDSFWYYGWDVASGVIWDEKALKSRNLLYTYNDKTGIYDERTVSRGKKHQHSK
jgi:hypothetical protein